VRSSSLNAEEVLIIKGNLRNFLKSLCDALSSGSFLWGFESEGDFKKVLEDPGRLVAFYVIGSGFTMVTSIEGAVEGSGLEPYWPDEVEADTVKYGYRFKLRPLKVSKCFSGVDACREDVRFGAECFASYSEVLSYVIERCGISERRKATIPLGASASIAKDCKAEKIIEYLESRFADFRPAPRADPLFDKLGELSVGRLVLVAHLAAGRNVLLVGPPGSGKTSLLTELLDALGVGYSVETGNPEWTPFDTIGGYSIRGDVVEGFVTRAVRRCSEELESRDAPYWLVIDEVNRANVDLAFGKLFTLLDPVYRVRERLRIGDREVEVPLSFRVLATMNSFDRALLHKLGYALMRRFAAVRHEDLNLLEEPGGLYDGVDIGRLRVYDRDGCLEGVGVRVERVVWELTLSRGRDYLVLSPRLHEMLSRGLGALFTVGGLRLDRVLACVSEDVINRKLEGYVDCEVCPVQVTPGVLADALKYVAVLNTLLGELRPGLDLRMRVGTVLDTAVASYVLPQLDVLADQAKLEEMSGGHGKLGGLLEEVGRGLGELGLELSRRLVGRLARGYHIV